MKVTRPDLTPKMMRLDSVEPVALKSQEGFYFQLKFGRAMVAERTGNLEEWGARIGMYFWVSGRVRYNPFSDHFWIAYQVHLSPKEQEQGRVNESRRSVIQNPPHWIPDSPRRCWLVLLLDYFFGTSTAARQLQAVEWVEANRSISPGNRIQ